MKLITKRIEQADWQQVKKLIQEDSLYVGDSVEDFVRSVPMTFEVAQVTDEGVLFISKELWPEPVQWNRERTNKGGFKESNVCRFLNEELFNMLPEDLQEVISEREVLQIVNGEEETFNVRLWLPSEYEVFGDYYWASDPEGQQLTYFKDARNRVKCDAKTGERASWWLLSVYGGNSPGACHVNGAGVANNTGTSTGYRVPVCFLIKK